MTHRPDPRDQAIVAMLTEEVLIAIGRHATPILQQAIDGGASGGIISSAVINASSNFMASTIAATTGPGDEQSMAETFVFALAGNLYNTDWDKLRTTLGRAATAPPAPPAAS